MCFVHRRLCPSNINLRLSVVVTIEMINILLTLSDSIFMKPRLGIKMSKYRGVIYAKSTNVLPSVNNSICVSSQFLY